MPILTAIRRFRLGMGPLNLLLLGLGGLYLYAWLRQSTPLQNYLSGCCWSRGGATSRKASPRHHGKSGDELDAIHRELSYSPIEGLTLPPIEIKELAWL
ncbi:hypothetical protein [Stutzerimonas nitrititolerans]|uniref:hypothetical protein n=1 Tax=Stutzerimonas nitrititolerans TaxID=2482751 RepID=UPI00289746D6|nr:hypothetical protein [Stutzerimonas nitrititolerans]